MSRFYDLLRQASRSSQNVPWMMPETEESGAVGEAGLDNPETLFAPDVSAANEPDASPVQEEPVVSLAEELLQSEPVLQNGAIGTSVPVNMDNKARLIPYTADRSVVEQYRILRTRIAQQQQGKKKLKTLLVTSPGPQEGKTVTVLNLGMTFALQPSTKVLVVDADLRRGSLGTWLGVRDRPGFCDLIEGSATLEEVVLKSDQVPFHFLVRGNSKMSPGELLQQPNLPALFRKMTDRFDLVLVDSPPLGLLADSQLLASSCDAVLLVARVFVTRISALEKAIQELQRYRVIGTVLNCNTGVFSSRRYGSYY